jgi:uncharacterized membrane protein YfcA
MMRRPNPIPTVLIVFMVFQAWKLGYAVLYRTNGFVYLHGSMALIYGVASFLTYRRNKIASWVMIFALLLSGTLGLILGVFLVSLSQLVLKTVFTTLGVYFIYGSYKLYQARKNPANQASQDQFEA